MARKSVTVRLDADNRDKGKAFLITEMDALDAWNWGTRAITAMIRNGAKIPEEVANGGIIPVLAVGVFQFGFLPWSELEPLRDEMMACVQYVPTPARPDVVRKLMRSDVEEPDTYSRLMKEVFSLHTGFFPEGSPSTSPPSPPGADAAPS